MVGRELGWVWGGGREGGGSRFLANLALRSPVWLIFGLGPRKARRWLEAYLAVVLFSVPASPWERLRVQSVNSPLVH